MALKVFFSFFLLLNFEFKIKTSRKKTGGGKNQIFVAGVCKSKKNVSSNTSSIVGTHNRT